MPQDHTSNPSSNMRARTPPAGPSRQSQTGKFVFPGSLSLHMKRLRKGENENDYKALHNLRYQVYCHEAHFLNPDNYPAGLEIDEFDAVSEHFLAANAASNDDIVGTVRLVRWSQHLLFPTAVYFESLLEHLGRLKFPLDSTAEISRLCISKQYRRRAMDGLLGVETSKGRRAIDGLLGVETKKESSHGRRRYPEVILELFKTIYFSSRFDLGITHWIATFEDSLYRLLNRYGVHFTLITPDEINYYGKVRIYGASIRQVEETMKLNRPDLFAFFCEQADHA